MIIHLKVRYSDVIETILFFYYLFYPSEYKQRKLKKL